MNNNNNNNNNSNQDAKKQHRPQPPRGGAPAPYVYNPYSTPAANYAAPYQNTAAPYGYVTPIAATAAYHPYYVPQPQGYYNVPTTTRTSAPSSGATNANTPKIASSLQSAAAAYVPRKKSPLVITDKDGKPIDLSSVNTKAKTQSSELQKKAKEKAEEKEKEALKLKLEAEKLELEAKAAAEKSRLEAKIAAEKLAAKAEAEKLEAEKLQLQLQKLKLKQEAEAKAEAEAAEAEEELLVKQQQETEKQQQQQPLRPGGRVTTKNNPCKLCRKIYSKSMLMSFRDLEISLIRPASLPDMSIALGAPKGSSSTSPHSHHHSSNNMRRNNSSEWSRGSRPPPGIRHGDSIGTGTPGAPGGNRQHQQQGGGGGGEWSRGRAPPPKKKTQRQNSGNQNNNDDLYDGPVAPLTRSSNRWRPVSSNSDIVTIEKKSKAILNKMTKEKYDRLSQQMCELSIPTSAVLEKLIEIIYDKAVEEPSFGDVYAALCSLLSSNVGVEQFVHVIPGYESRQNVDANELLKADRSAAGNVSYFQWSTDINTTDAEVVGPFTSPSNVLTAALSKEQDIAPVPRSSDLKLHKLLIVENTFVKIMVPVQEPEDGEELEYYAVYHPVSEQTDEEEGAAEQQQGQTPHSLSSETFMTAKECFNHAKKLNSFKRLLLNKCQDEFSKQDIYADWQKEFAIFQSTKSTLAESARLEQEEELEFRRMKIKKLMIGNIRFIGELFKKQMLRDTVIHECMNTLMKLENRSTVKGMYDIVDKPDAQGMDEEDHEGLCQLFNTIGKVFDTPANANPMTVYFSKIRTMSKPSSKLSSRARFAYQDLIELRKNGWKARRKEESSMTLQEIKKEFEREERAAARISAAGGGGHRRQHQHQQQGMHHNQQQGMHKGSKKQYAGNRDGGSSLSRATHNSHNPTILSRNNKSTSTPMKSSTPSVGNKSVYHKSNNSNIKSASISKTTSGTAPLSQDQFKKRIKSILQEYASHNDSKELLLAIDDLKSTVDWTVMLTTSCLELAIECSHTAELEVICRILTILGERQMLGTTDYISALTGILEFMNDFVIDIPKAYDYMSTTLAHVMHHAQAVKITDVMKICSKLNSEAVNSALLLKSVLTELHKQFGKDAVIKSSGLGNQQDQDMVIQCIGKEEWNKIMS